MTIETLTASIDSADNLARALNRLLGTMTAMFALLTQGMKALQSLRRPAAPAPGA